MSVNISTGQPTFYQFIRQDKINRWFLYIALPAILIQWGLFKIFYPFASFFFTDSFAYLYAAGFNLDAHIWPVGYSKFLRVFNTLVHSDTGLVSFQYLFLHSCSLYFFFRVRLLFRPSKPVSIILFSLLVFNPLFLYLANSVSSDALFIGLSLCWISQLMQMIGSPSRSGIFWHALLLAGLFFLRYTAIYYPLISAIAILFSAYSRKEKLWAMTLPLLLVAGFIYYTAHAMQESTGLRKFSPFSGWQLANNALYMYGHLRKGPLPVVPARFSQLDRTIRSWFDTAKTERTLFDEEYPGIYFLWQEKGPLQSYMALQQKKDTVADYFKTWAAVSPLYQDYAGWWIRQYPFSYIRYYCWPNVQRYAFPPLEFMGRYNSGMDTVEQIASSWFRYKDRHVRAFSKDFQAYFLIGYPFLNMVLHLFFFGLSILFLTTPGMGKTDPLFTRCLLLMICLWVLHFGFSVWAAPVVLRYQVFLMIGCCSFSLLMGQRLLERDTENTTIKINSNEKDQYDRRGLRLFTDTFIRVRRDE